MLFVVAEEEASFRFCGQRGFESIVLFAYIYRIKCLKDLKVEKLMIGGMRKGLEVKERRRRGKSKAECHGEGATVRYFVMEKL